MNPLCLLLILALSNVALATNATIIPPLPEKQGLQPVALIVIPGAQINNSAYGDLVAAIQQQSSTMAIWGVLPAFFAELPLPIPPFFGEVVQAAISELYDAGFPREITKHAFLGHSLGSASIQSYLFSNPQIAFAQIITGGALLRQYRNESLTGGKPYPVPTITIAGELDGLMRLSRIAEGYYHQISNPQPVDSAGWVNFPIHVLLGHNHMQVASGPAPATVLKMDLKAEISFDESHQLIAQSACAFLDVQYLGVNNAPDAAALQQKLTNDAGTLLDPLISSLVLEANHRLAPPCNSDHPAPHCPYYAAWPIPSTPRTPSPDSFCWCGVPWVSQVAQPVLANVSSDRYNLTVVDAQHDVTNINPFHHPHSWTNCSQATEFPCALNTSTVSQNMYASFDDFDTGFVSMTASELRVKMKSRQDYRRCTTDPFAVWTDYDNNVNANYCGEINQLALEWAWNNAGSTARARYSQYGQQLVIGADIFPLLEIGPLWIYNPLNYTQTVDASGRAIVEVTAPLMITSVDGPDTKIDPPMLSGYHYCKLLSPAYVMEWMYTDGLRHYMPIPPNN